MLYPDPMQRTVLGGQTRWVAGLFALLMVAVGAIPVSPARGADLLVDARSDALAVAAENERATGAEVCVATGELIGATTGVRIEGGTEAPDLDASCLPHMIRSLDRREPGRSDRFDHDFATGRPGCDRSAPRAPPLA